MGIEPPTVCSAPPLESVLAAVLKSLVRQNGDSPSERSDARYSPRFAAQRVLVYAADAIGRVFLDNHPDLKKRLVDATDLAVELRAMMPPKTPVCFASMFTGALPEVHGIRKYERPVLTCDTLFDALARRDRTEIAGTAPDCGAPSAGDCPPPVISDRVPSDGGHRVAIVAVKDCSMDIIFRSRPIDYFSEEDDAAVLRRALSLLRDARHDFIVSYNQEYDDTLHATRHDGPEAVAAAGRHVDTFMRLRQAVEDHWANHNRALLFVSDHGAHYDAAKGKGDHGEDIPEDVDVVHFWRARPAAPADPSGRA